MSSDSPFILKPEAIEHTANEILHHGCEPVKMINYSKIIFDNWLKAQAMGKLWDLYEKFNIKVLRR